MDEVTGMASSQAVARTRVSRAAAVTEAPLGAEERAAYYFLTVFPAPIGRKKFQSTRDWNQYNKMN
jgi:hypothetical protein